MLGSRMSAQDEDEVEDELAALEAATRRPVKLPEVPDTALPEQERPAPAEEEAQPARAPMLAS